MAVTLADIAVLDAALVSGIKRVTFADGRTTEYQSGSDMLAARTAMLAAINAAERAAAGVPRKRYARFGSGL